MPLSAKKRASPLASGSALLAMGRAILFGYEDYSRILGKSEASHTIVVDVEMPIDVYLLLEVFVLDMGESTN